MKKKDFEVSELPIRLGQLIKLMGLVENGREAKTAIASGAIMVNGSVCIERGRKIFESDIVIAGDGSYQIIQTGKL